MPAENIKCSDCECFTSVDLPTEKKTRKGAAVKMTENRCSYFNEKREPEAFFEYCPGAIKIHVSKPALKAG